MKIFFLIVLLLIYHFVLEQLFFNIMAFIYGRLCKHDCSKCKCWNCTHDSKYDYHDLIMKDYSKICGKDIK